MSIAPIRPPNPLEIQGAYGAGTTPSIRGFDTIDALERPSRDKLDLGDSFTKALQEAHSAEKTSNHANEQFAKGDPTIGIHEVVIASEKANISVRYMTTLKNKALEAYRELLNTQV